MPTGQRVNIDIARARAARGWSQERLAEVCGISHRTARRAEAGHPMSPRVAGSILAALAPWPTGVVLPTAVVVGRREFRSGERTSEETSVVVAALNGWRVDLRYSSGLEVDTWCLGADGFCRTFGHPKAIPFATQAEAIVAAVWRLERFRRVNHPVLCQRRRDAMGRHAGRMPREDVWDDAFMARLDAPLEAQTPGT